MHAFLCLFAAYHASFPVYDRITLIRGSVGVCYGPFFTAHIAKCVAAVVIDVLNIARFITNIAKCVAGAVVDVRHISFAIANVAESVARMTINMLF